MLSAAAPMTLAADDSVNWCALRGRRAAVVRYVRVYWTRVGQFGTAAPGSRSLFVSLNFLAFASVFVVTL